MADNIIQRIIKLILDKSAADKVKDENQSVVDAVEGSWKKAAERIAEFLGVAFLIDKIVEFGKAAVEHAAEVDSTWRALKGTIDATGTSFDNMSESLHASAEAFEAATIHKDEEYASSLTRLITLTGDVTASTNNMGLVANVAAAFYKGDLEPAVNLVAKAMNGNVMMLQRLGIHAKDAQEALDILFQRTMNRATIEATAFDGQMKQIHNSFVAALEDFGNAIIKSDGATDAMGFLRNAVQAFDDWINKNKDSISTWVTNGVAFAIDAVDVLIRAFELLSGVAMTPVYFSFAAITEAMYFFVKAASAVNTVMMANAIARGGDIALWVKNQVAIDKATKSLEDYGNAAKQLEKEALDRAGKALTEPLFDSEQFKKPRKTPALDVPPPMVGSSMSDKNTKEVENAIAEFEKATKAAENMKKILGDSFDSVGAEIDRTTKLLNVLAGQGIPAADKGFGELPARLHTLVTETKPVQDIMKALAKTLDADLNEGFASAQTGTEGAITQLQVLEKMQKATQSAMDEMIKKGIKPTSAAYQDLVREYQAYTVAIADMKPIQATIDATKNLAKALDKDLADGMRQGKSSAQILEAQMKSVETTMDDLRKNKVDPTSEAFLKFQRQWDELNKAFKQATGIKQLADELRALGDTIRKDLAVATLQGASALDKLKIEQQDLEKQIAKMMARALPEEAKELAQLEERYKGVTAAVKEQTIALQAQTVAADFLADALGAALTGGLHDAAAAKAKENAVQAAEMLVRAGFFALFGNFPAAGAALGLAAQFGAVALAWEALAASSGGGSSSSSPSIPVAAAGGTPSGGAAVSSARSTSSASTSASSTIPADVSIYLVGPGFDATNPRVQEVVWGAAQQASERYGQNTRIRVRPNQGQG